MKTKKLFYISLIAAAPLMLASCDDFLDETPDSRTEIDNEVKAEKILVEAYPRTAFIQVNELMSDNHDM